MTLDVERTTYHETEDKIWRIDSGTDYGEIWDLDVFEDHAEDYLGKGEEAQTDSVGAIEILETDFGERGYKLIKDNKADEFHLLFYIENKDPNNPKQYIDKIWEDEIGTILSETAKEKIALRHEMRESDDLYRQRLSETI